MSNVSINNANLNMQNISPEMQKRLESGENFGAIDTQKIKEDTVEITQNATEYGMDIGEDVLAGTARILTVPVCALGGAIGGGLMATSAGIAVSIGLSYMVSFFASSKSKKS